MNISIIIPAFNEEKYIGKTLESIKHVDTNGFDVEIIVVDNNSVDKTAEVAREFGATVYTITSPGVGFARQYGLKRAKGDIVLYTDSDTVAPKDWITRHVTALQRSGVSCTFGSFRVSGKVTPFSFHANYLQPYWIGWVNTLLGIPTASGQNIAFWKDLALKAGGFDENLKIFEDIDFAIRLKKMGKVVYLGDSIVHTSGRRSNEGWGYFVHMAVLIFKYFLLRQRNLGGFQSYR